MALPLPETVDAPEITPPQSGLIPAADKIGRVHEVDDDRFGVGGITYRPETLGGARARSTQSDAEGADVNTSDNEDHKGGLVTAYPIVLSVEETCSAMSIRDQAVYEGRARRRLLALGGQVLEREFWTGEVAQQDGLDPAVYQWLAQQRVDAAGDVPAHGAVDLTPAGGATDPRHALGIIEQALGDTGTGAGFIHMSRKMATMMPDRWSDGPLITWPDSVVSIGAGFPGTVGPDGTEAPDGEEWVYGTNLCDVWLGSVQLFPNTLAEALDRRKNTISYRAERFGAVSWDGNVHVAIRVTV